MARTTLLAAPLNRPVAFPGSGRGRKMIAPAPACYNDTSIELTRNRAHPSYGLDLGTCFANSREPLGANFGELSTHPGTKGLPNRYGVSVNARKEASICAWRRKTASRT